jgi:hypothetical protein
MTIFPSCNSFESWEKNGAPCLSCQFGNITFQNPFESLLEILINTWLPISSDLENNNLDDSNENDDGTCNFGQTTGHTFEKTSQDALFKLWHAAINESLNEIRSKRSIGQNQNVFQDLTNIQRELQNNKKGGYLTYDPPSYDSDHEATENTISVLQPPLATLDPNISLGVATLKWPSSNNNWTARDFYS